MGSYALASVSASNEGVRLWSTDWGTLDRITDELKKFIPRYSIKEERNLLSGEIYFYWIANLQNRDYEVGAWIVKQLCLQGWEPFAAESFAGQPHFVYLKLKYGGEV
jgi:hypothetical protein